MVVVVRRKSVVVVRKGTDDIKMPWVCNYVECGSKIDEGKFLFLSPDRTRLAKRSEVGNGSALYLLVCNFHVEKLREEARRHNRHLTEPNNEEKETNMGSKTVVVVRSSDKTAAPAQKRGEGGGKKVERTKDMFKKVLGKSGLSIRDSFVYAICTFEKDKDVLGFMKKEFPDRDTNWEKQIPHRRKRQESGAYKEDIKRISKLVK